MKTINFIIEGCDKLGKDFLINEIKKKYGYFTVIHHSTPVSCEHYFNKAEKTGIIPEFLYQRDSFLSSMTLLKLAEFSSTFNLILNRSWIGEYVYAPMYRNYSGEYVFELEQIVNIQELDKTFLILLTTSNWEFIKDDGLSLDFSRKEEEQDLFLNAFEKSKIKNKIVIDINENGYYKDINKIFSELNI